MKNSSDLKSIFKSSKVYLIIIISISLALVSFSDNINRSEIDIAVGKESFSIFWWEVKHLPSKWAHLLWENFPGNRPTHEERIEILEKYLETVNKLTQEETRLKVLKSTVTSHDQAVKKQLVENLIDEITYLKQLRESYRGRAEETVEATISLVANQQNLGLFKGLLFPPTDFHFDKPPHILIISPRSKIELKQSKLISPTVTDIVKSEIESGVEKDGTNSALVDSLAGLGTYPAFVTDRDGLDNLMITAAHEWLHNYWFFKPLGRNMWNSSQMYTLNETAADIAGTEIGQQAFELIVGDSSRDAPYNRQDLKSHPHLRTILKETRNKVDILLENGLIDQAEKYMREQRWRLKLGGYNIRKLNQAYYAFRGKYADGPASISPIGEELKEYRSYFSNTGAFVRSISRMRTYEHFQEELRRLRNLVESG